MRRIVAVSLLLLAAVLGHAAAQTPTTPALPRGMSAASCVEGICEYRLDNGMRVLLFADASKPGVTVNITYAVGSVNEGVGESGMAHLLEHLMFKGTPKNPNIPEEMRRRGISYNATTASTRTNYFGSFPADDATLGWLLALEADRMRHSRIARSDLDSEMTVVRNELESGENSPGAVLSQRLRSAAFHWHPLGRSTIGVRSDVENVSIERLQAFYRTWYQPDTATLIVAGRIDPARTLAMIAREFGALPRPTRALPTLYTVEPVQDGEREVVVRRRGDMRMTSLFYHAPAVTHPDMPALLMLSNILADVPAGRLHKTLVETGIAAGATGGVSAQRYPDGFVFSALAPKDGDPARTETALIALAENLSAKPFTADELGRAQQRIATAYELAYNDVGAVAMALTEYQAVGDWRLWFVLRDAMAKVTLEDLQRVARTYLVASNRTLARFVPTEQPVRAVITPAPAVATLVDGYRGRAAVDAGEAFEATPENIARRTEIVRVGRLEIALLPKRNRGQTVAVDIDFDFNDIDVMRRTHPLASVLAGALLMGGSRSMSREQIDQRFTELKTGASITGNAQGASIGLSTRRDTLVDALKLAADILRHPAYPENEYRQMIMQMRTVLEAIRREPGTQIAQAMGAHFDPWPADHPLRHVPLDEATRQLDTITLEQVRDYHARHYGTAVGRIAIVGDFDPEAVRALLPQLFGDWMPAVPYAPIPTRYTDVPPERRSFETPDKPNAQFSARMNIPLSDADPDYQAIVVANAILGGDGLKSRLADRVRQRDGLSYAISSSISADSSIDGKDDAGTFGISAIAAPQNMPRLEAAVREELQRFVRDGITEQELRDTVNAMLVARRQARAQDGTIAGMLTSDLYRRRSMLRRSEQDAALQRLTVAQVNAAIRRFLHPDRLSVYVAGDFAQAGKPQSAPAATPP